MILNLIDKIGNWNPQLFREIKGRLKIGNIAIASTLSLCGQLLLFMYFSAQIVAPPHGQYINPIYRTFCTFNKPDFSEPKCVRDALGNFAINWQQWWLGIFMSLSFLSILALLVAGTYQLVSDLDKEERRGTLNFIRLSPQSAKTIFIGKILGVPILLYLAAILAVPLHLYSGLAAQIPLNGILCFYIAVLASCALFYSAAMLFGLTTSWLGGFQPWLASGMAFVMCWLSVGPSTYYYTRNAFDLLRFLSPIAILSYLPTSDDDLRCFFHLPVATNIAICLAFSLLVCGTGTYWLWQGWQRRFPNPSATVLSKRQSYLAVICSQTIILGFALLDRTRFSNDIRGLLIFNLLIFLALIAALTSERQSLYDWARYRQQIVPSGQKLWWRYLLLDLIWSEKSPALVAIAINLLSSLLMISICSLIYLSGSGNDLSRFSDYKYADSYVDSYCFHKHAFWLLICFMNLILIYASIAQLFLFTKNRNREIWAVGTVVSAIILLPPLILSMLSIAPVKAPFLWFSSTLFVDFRWSSFVDFRWSSFTGLGNTILFSILSQWTVLVLLNLKLRSQLKLAGESASKALLKSSQIDSL